MSNLISWASDKLGALEDRVVHDYMVGWTPADIPDMHGKVALVTGANSGLGYETARKLAENGAKVYMVSRDLKNGERAAARIRAEMKKAQVEVMECDMSALSNVVELVNAFKRTGDPLHILVNMAGVFHPGPYAKTKDGLEQTLGVNYYAHALLTLGLLDRLRATPGARCIMMASSAETFGKLDWNNLTGEHYKDSGMTPYGTTKTYMLMLARELSSRVPEVDFIGVHPGLVMTPLQHKASLRYWTAWLITTAARLFGQTEYRGAYSSIFAATDPSLTGAGFKYIGPNALNLYPTTERQPASRPVHNPVSCWKLFEETVRILESKVGRGVMTVPPHPDDVWGSSAPVHSTSTKPNIASKPIKAA